MKSIISIISIHYTICLLTFKKLHYLKVALKTSLILPGISNENISKKFGISRRIF